MHNLSDKWHNWILVILAEFPKRSLGHPSRAVDGQALLPIFDRRSVQWDQESSNFAAGWGFRDTRHPRRFSETARKLNFIQFKFVTSNSPHGSHFSLFFYRQAVNVTCLVLFTQIIRYKDVDVSNCIGFADRPWISQCEERQKSSIYEPFLLPHALTITMIRLFDLLLRCVEGSSWNASVFYQIYPLYEFQILYSAYPDGSAYELWWRLD